MRDRLAEIRTRVHGGDWRRAAERAGLVGWWLLRVSLGVVLVVYALSFVGPPPVDSVELEYRSPAPTVHDAVSNLRAGTYSVALEGNRSVGDDDSETFLQERRVVDNRGHRYLRQQLTRDAGNDGGATRRHTYGTYTTGYAQRARAPDGEVASGESGGAWTRERSLRYHPTINVFEAISRLNDSRATVVANTTGTYDVQITDPDVVADVVALPGHTQRREEPWNVTLTVSISRDDDRLTRAEYRYWLPDGDREIRATYRFEYGAFVDVDRPLGTYPPGEEAVGRVDLGVRAIHELARGMPL